jgi:hypothetical protein
MLNALVTVSAPFQDVPLDASEFEFSNPLVSVDPTTGAPIQAQQPAPVAATVPVVTASGSGGTWFMLLAAAALVAYFYWPEIKAEVSKYA